MTNCKKEFIEHTKGKNILCAELKHDCDYWDDDIKRSADLKIGFSQNDFEMFLRSLDYEYDDGYGGQELFGVIWYTDGTWSERGEYDGSEWWEYKSVPSIPDSLK